MKEAGTAGPSPGAAGPAGPGLFAVRNLKRFLMFTCGGAKRFAQRLEGGGVDVVQGAVFLAGGLELRHGLVERAGVLCALLGLG